MLQVKDTHSASGTTEVRRLRVLVVDDEPRIVNFLRLKLEACGYEVVTASNGAQALEQVQAQEPDIVVLDLVMPKKDGLNALKELRTFSAMPVIILSAKGADEDRIKGLELGADDYLCKPFNPDELVARIRAMMRRANVSHLRGDASPVQFDDVAIDPSKREVVVGGREKHLTRIEWLLLSELARNAGRLMLYEDLLARVWGPEYREDIQLLRTWMSRLRRKLEDERREKPLIRTMAKAGYMMEPATNDTGSPAQD
ncbi:MAG: response regulator transcription factor [Chloroflexi bacterium]|nr:response regulator transcription factor [Chloroflexota bacterium]